MKTNAKTNKLGAAQFDHVEAGIYQWCSTNQPNSWSFEALNGAGRDGKPHKPALGHLRQGQRRKIRDLCHVGHSKSPIACDRRRVASPTIIRCRIIGDVSTGHNDLGRDLCRGELQSDLHVTRR